MREALFRFFAALLAAVILWAVWVLIFTDATLVGSVMDAMWMGGVSLVLLSTFTVMAIAGPKKAHQILVRGMNLLGMVEDESVPEKLEPGSKRQLEGRDEEPDEDIRN